MNGLAKKLIVFGVQICYLYSDYVNTSTDYIFKPISEFLSYYSSSLSHSIDNINKILSGLVIYLPVFIVSFILVYILSDTPLINEYRTYASQYQSLLAVIFVVSSVVSLYLSEYVLDNKWTDTFYLFFILFFSSVFMMYYNRPPYSYFVLFIVFYGIGGYSQAKIDFEKSVRQSYIYNELESHVMILTASVASIFVVLMVLFVDAHVNNLYRLKSSQLILCLFVYAITIYQETQYRSIYSSIDISTTSRFWILTPQVSVVSGSMIILYPDIPSIYGAPLISMPFVFGLFFYMYFEYMTNSNMGDIVFRGNEERIYGESKQTVLDNISVQSQSEKTKTTLSVQLDIEVDNQKRDITGENLAESLIILSHIEDVILDSSVEASSSHKTLKEFYNTQIDYVIDGDLDIEQLPQNIKHRTVARMSETDKITNQEIQDINMKDKSTTSR